MKKCEGLEHMIWLECEMDIADIIMLFINTNTTEYKARDIRNTTYLKNSKAKEINN